MSRDPDADTPRRHAREGERCVCGRPAVVVYLVDEGRSAIAWCGLDIHDVRRDLEVAAAAARRRRAWGYGGARRRLSNVAAAVFVAVVLAGAVDTPSADAASPYQPARCEWLAPHLEAAGLPVGTFLRISWRESGCARRGVHVANRTDLSSSRFGLNFRTAGLRRTWARWCGATHWTQPGASVTLDVRCVAEAYERMGMRPWRG